MNQELPRYEAIARYAESLNADRYRKAGRDLEFDLQVYHSLLRQNDEIKDYEAGNAPEATPDYAMQLMSQTEDPAPADSVL